MKIDDCGIVGSSTFVVVADDSMKLLVEVVRQHKVAVAVKAVAELNFGHELVQHMSTVPGVPVACHHGESPGWEPSAPTMISGAAWSMYLCR